MPEPLEEVKLDHPDVQAHLDAQADAPDGMVRMADGTLRPLGGNADNGEDE